jgi:hypothetical protein
MQVAKLRIAGDSGLVPAGAYFKRLAADLREANAREAELREELDAEDRELEALYRGASASRGNTYATDEKRAVM